MLRIEINIEDFDALLNAKFNYVNTATDICLLYWDTIIKDFNESLTNTNFRNNIVGLNLHQSIYKVSQWL